MKPIFQVGVYEEDTGHRANTVRFKHQWQAFLFHLLLNRSLSHNGTREY